MVPLWSGRHTHPLAVPQRALGVRASSSVYAFWWVSDGTLAWRTDRRGQCTGDTIAGAFLRRFLRWRSIHALAWYLFSAAWFGEVYLWSCPSAAELAWLTPAR